MAPDRLEKWQAKDEGAGSGPLLDRLLRVRGFKSQAEIEAFLNPGLDQVHDPFLLEDMAKAVEIIAQAVKDKKRILIFGDYDADGLTATALLVRFFRRLGLEPDYLIPDRLNGGYGLSDIAVDLILKRGCELLITVDCGITSVAEIERLKSRGIKTIITDHHELGHELPAAASVINPKRPGQAYPFSELAGVGVALKLVMALCSRFDLGDLWLYFIDLFVVGTVADIVSLTDENRALTAYGLTQLNRAEKQNLSSPGLDRLMQKNVSGERITARDLSFSVSPRLNAAGRMDNASLALELLLADQPARIEELVLLLDELNDQRRLVENRIFEEATAQIRENDASRQPIILAFDPDWHVGVLGIAANRLAEAFAKPVIVLTREADELRGSCRSWGSIDILAALDGVTGLFERFGGHQAAAGLSMRPEKLPALKEALSGIIIDDVSKAREADLIVWPEELTGENALLLERLEPFGAGNPGPEFICCGLTVTKARTLSDGRHLKMNLAFGPDLSWEGISFGKGGQKRLLADGERLDILFSLTINRWRDRQNVQLLIRDFRPTDGIYSVDIPRPDDYRQIYLYLHQEFKDRAVSEDLAVLSRAIGEAVQREISAQKLYNVLSVFAEIGLLGPLNRRVEQIELDLLPVEAKVELAQSATYRRLTEIIENGVM